jgi:IstB-like ATP binding protein
MSAVDPIDAGRLTLALNDLRLPAIKLVWPELAARADKEGWPAARFLAALAEHEIAERANRRIQRHLEGPRHCLGPPAPRQDARYLQLRGGPGDQQGADHGAGCRRQLAGEGRQLARLRPTWCGQIAYVTKDQAETSVIFELIAARYERRSLFITANQPFGEWHRIFPDQVMTLAAVDRLVHHATIFEMNVESYRRRTAVERKRGPGRPPTRATINTSS